MMVKPAHEQWPRQGGGELIDAYFAPGSPTDAYASCSHTSMAALVRQGRQTVGAPRH